MEHLLKWLSNYSTPVVMLLVVGAAALYSSQTIIKKTVESEFEKRNSRIELMLKRRSSFEEKILLDQYSTIRKFNHNLASISANVNRAKTGADIEGLYNGEELVPLTDLFVELQANKYLLRESTHTLLTSQAYAVLKLSNSKNEEEYQNAVKVIIGNDEKMHEEMNSIFGIEKISWSTLGSVNE